MNQILTTSTRFFRFLIKSSGSLFWLALLLSLLVTATEGIGVLLLLPMLDAAGIETQSAGVGRVSELVTQFIGWLGLTPGLGPVLLLFFLTMVAHEAVNRLRTVTNRKLQTQVASRLRGELFDAIAHSQWTFFCRQRVASMSNTLTLDVERVLVATKAVQTGSVALSVALLYLLFAVYISPGVSLLVTATGVILYLTIAWQLKTSRRIGKRTAERYDSIYRLTSEYLSAMKTVKSYGQVDDCVARFERANQDLSKVHLDDGKHQAKMEQRYKIGSALALCLIIYLAVAVLNVPTADLLFLLVLFSRVMPKLSLLTHDSFLFSSHVPSFEAVESLLDQCRANAGSVIHVPSQAIETPLSSGVEVDDVSFAYQESTPVLTGVSLEIPSRTMVAIVGASGAGKTTLLDLIMGLMLPDSGVIRLDGRELTESLMQSMRRWIGYVGQDTFLFNASVRENLLWGAPEADETAIEQVLRTVRAEFVHDLPNGLDTPVGDRGGLLSGGQRQRLSLARALLREPHFLVLDEATSALDMDNESRIMRAVNDLRGAMTILIVSHRPSAVRDSDLVHVLDSGTIVASGSWSDVRHEARTRTLIH